MKNTKWAKFEGAIWKVLSVSHEELKRREEQRKRDRAKKKRAKTSPAPAPIRDDGSANLSATLQDCKYGGFVLRTLPKAQRTQQTSVYSVVKVFLRAPAQSCAAVLIHDPVLSEKLRTTFGCAHWFQSLLQGRSRHELHVVISARIPPAS